MWAPWAAPSPRASGLGRVWVSSPHSHRGPHLRELSQHSRPRASGGWAAPRGPWGDCHPPQDAGSKSKPAAGGWAEGRGGTLEVQLTK